MTAPTLTDLQKTQIVYAHFTLEQWTLIASLVARSALADTEKMDIMVLMPSAAIIASADILIPPQVK